MDTEVEVEELIVDDLAVVDGEVIEVDDALVYLAVEDVSWILWVGIF